MPTKKTTTKKTAAKKSLSTIRNEVASFESEDTTTRNASAARAKEAVATASSITAEGAVNTLSRASLDITKSLSELQGKVIEQVQTFSEINEAIAAKEAELQTLFDKEVVALDLVGLLARRDLVEQEIEDRAE